MPACADFGIVGLGQIGGGLAMQALDKGRSVAGYDVEGVNESLRQAGLTEIRQLEEFQEKLRSPRIVFLYVPAGPVVDEVLDELVPELEPGDVVVDGGNSYWRDSLLRHERLASRNIRFVDLGTSGGIEGARHGACFMAGGDEEALEQVEPILKSLMVNDGHIYQGPPGSGHYVKLVHNGIEFGMLQAIGEGIALLRGHEESLDLSSILRCWNHGSVIRSWLVELMEKEYSDDRPISDVPPYVEDTGEVNWLVSDAMRMEIEVPVIAASVMQLFTSRNDQQDWARAIAMMRHGFGGHPFGEDQSIAEERETGRVTEGT